MFQSVMKNDLEVIDRFAQKGVEKETLGTDMKTPVNVLRHAACVPVYEFLKNQIISPDTPAFTGSLSVTSFPENASAMKRVM